VREILPCDYCTEGNRFAEKPPLYKRILGGLGLYQKCIGPTEPIALGIHSLELKAYADGRTNMQATTKSAQKCPAIVLDPTLSTIGEHVVSLSQTIPLESQEAR